MTVYKEKRAYEPPMDEDGFRVYVDRIWPRGMSHAAFHYDLWEKEIAPSTGLRHWFHADPQGRWEEFESKYTAELKNNQALDRFKQMIAVHPVVTLLYSSREREHNNATVLKNFLEKDERKES